MLELNYSFLIIDNAGSFRMSLKVDLHIQVRIISVVTQFHHCFLCSVSSVG